MLSPQDRLREINNLFLRKTFQVNYRRVEQYLFEQFDILSYSERSFSRDINTLKELLQERYPSLEEEQGELIRFSRSTFSFYYVRQDISAFPSFSEKELNQIASMIDLNQHLFTDGIGKGIVNKLRAIILENNLSNYHEILAWPSIQLIKDGERAGSDLIKPILEAIAAKNCLLFSYQSLSKSARHKTYQGIPLMIKEYNNGWYTGWYVLIQEVKEHERWVKTDINSLRLFALDRMENLQVVNSKYQLRFAPDFYPPNYFKNMLGILRNNLTNPEIKTEKVSVCLNTDNWLLEYLTKYPLHPSQQIDVRDGSNRMIHITWHIEINVELESFLMRYANDLEVLNPENLRKQIKEKLEQALSMYQ
ncbi:helix-turn-helix transcriptional regulator [Aquirufa ecclesiirivi]|uniref:helix-turn-helix transcriptional regulator n=1 Tax=Aquirufa ecclesiirivi TaxID=2715124 RepID=UPI00140AECF7|nr:WYL domain-containing protein [Aquirufa ecclesiirivi]NHC50120.1 WYL domain-containing protein [Aquirufa ecclesiirivi]